MTNPPPQPGDAPHGQQPPAYGAPQVPPSPYGQPGGAYGPPGGGYGQAAGASAGYGQAPWGSGAPQGGPDSPKNFFAALFDWRFHTLITPKLVSWVYLAVMVLSVLYWLFLLVVSFAGEPLLGLGVLIFGPIVLVVSLAFFRMTLEFYFALVRMSDDIHRSRGVPRA